MEEILGLVRCWSVDAPPREQTMSQNHAEEQFDHYIQQVKDAGLIVSPVKRSLRIERHDTFSMAYYYQRAKVIGSEEALQQLKARFENK